eukprot:scaffold34429_cov108-Isochrysis_galbana.AAC.1
MAVMEKEFGEEELDARQEFESAKEEIKNKNSEEYNVLRFTLEGLIEELEKHFDSAHANYTATTEQRTIDFKSLTLKDQQRWARDSAAAANRNPRSPAAFPRFASPRPWRSFPRTCLSFLLSA